MKKTFYIRIICLLIVAFSCTKVVSQNDVTTDKKAKKEAAAKLKLAKKEKKNKADAVYKETETTMKDMFLFGVARSYIDSVTYLSNVTPIKSAVFDKTTGFPVGLEMYTQQLERYLLEKGKIGFVCCTFYEKTRKKAEKKYLKLKKRFEKQSFASLNPLGDFYYKYAETENIYRHTIDDKVLEEEAVTKEIKGDDAEVTKSVEKKPKKAKKSKKEI